MANLGAVSLVLVTDAMEDNGHWLDVTFGFVRGYKNHYVVLQHRTAGFSDHHRVYLDRARRKSHVATIDLRDYLDELCQLYGALKTRHALSGIHAFSRGYFEALAMMPELTTTAAFQDDRMICACTWLEYQELHTRISSAPATMDTPSRRHTRSLTRGSNG